MHGANDASPPGRRGDRDPLLIGEGSQSKLPSPVRRGGTRQTSGGWVRGRYAAAAAGVFLRLRQRGKPEQAKNGPRFPMRNRMGFGHSSHFLSFIWGGGRWLDVSRLSM